MTRTEKRFGDRKDGRKLRTLRPMDAMIPYIMVERNDACNFIRDRFDIVAAERYVRRMREEGRAGFGLMHLLVAAYVRTVSQRPGLNRYVSGQKVFARDAITVCIDVKREMALNAESTILKVEFDPADTARDVYDRFNGVYERAMAEDATAFDRTARLINLIPGLAKKFAVWLLKLFDYFDLLPRSLTSVSPFHCSLFITSMGSLGIPPVFHHLYNFGNVPVFLSFGAKYSEWRLGGEGKLGRRKYMDFTVVVDERICDGFYFASCLRLIHQYLREPELLDVPPERIVGDID